MKHKIIISLILILIFLTSCGMYNSSNFVMPDDLEFLEVIESLNTPEEISQYMINNFIYEAHLFTAQNPYTLFLSKKGDCNEFADFVTFVANYHGYETWQIYIYFKETINYHVIAVYEEDSKYSYSDNLNYHPINASTFKEVVEHYFTYQISLSYKSYKVLDYYNNLVEVK